MPPEHAINSSQRRWAAFVPPGRGKQWPWKNRNILLAAFCLMGLIAGATGYWGVRHFENRLDKSARGDLATAGVSLDNLDFQWSYRNLLLTGEVPANVGEQKIVNILRNTDNNGIRDIELMLTTVAVLPESSTVKGTIDVNAVLTDGKITLTGSVLSDLHRQRLNQAAISAVGAQNVVSQIEVSGLQESIPGADERVESFATSLAGLDKATSADASLSATDLSFNATVDDENQVDELLRRRGSAGDIGLVISGDIIAKKSAPGGVMDVSATKTADRIVLSGVVISDEQRQRLQDSAAAIVGESLVDNQITVVVGDGETALADDRIDFLVSAINTFPTTVEARARISVSDFDLDALVEFEEDSTRLHELREAASANGLNVDGTIESQRISLDREVSLLQEELDQLAEEIKENVVFESAVSELDFDAKQTLDKVVDAMNRYQRPVVVIAGHTDSSGASIDNEQLSLDRASSVREYLEISGIDLPRLRSLGFGEGVPIASNETEVGKKQNRRVEFSARSSFKR